VTGFRTAATWAALALLAIAPAAAVAEGQPALVPLPDGVIATGVRIAGIDVSGMTAEQARATLVLQHVEARMRPMLVTFKGKRFAVEPRSAGYSAQLDYAVQGALTFGRTQAVPPGGVDVPLRESVNRARIRALLTRRAQRLEVPAVDARLGFVNGEPRVRKARFGAKVDVPRAARLVATALLSRKFTSYSLPADRVVPAVTSIGAVIVIDRAAFRLRLYRGQQRTRTYPIAVGMAAYPTPAGRFRIIQKQLNPTWFPPSSPWARGLGPVPPGPGNPLGTRWMGTSAPAVGIHGTPASGSIGTRASHGCIRMYVRDAEDLYGRIEVGTPILIV
jgi:lipoprotein-anchoring transpeptidase ErfK/SrfK